MKTTDELRKKIAEIEIKLMVYDELADKVRILELENDLKNLNLQYLDVLMEEKWTHKLNILHY